MKDLDYQTSRFERLTYALYFLGQNFFYFLVAMFVQVYFTDMGLTATTVAAVLLITKIWDAVNDPIFGVIVDKVRWRKGRFLPWIRLSLVLVALTTLGIFLMPSSLAPGAKVAWAVVSYMLWDAAYTTCDVPIFALSTSMTSRSDERTAILSFGRLFATVGGMVVVVLMPSIRPALGWALTATVLVVAGLITMVPLCFVARERSVGQRDEEMTLRELAGYVVHNRYLLVLCLSLLVFNLTFAPQFTYLYFARSCLGDEAAGTPLIAIMTVPVLLVAALMPTIVRHVDKMVVFRVSIIGLAALSVLTWIVGYRNIAVFYIVQVFRGIFMGGYSILEYLFTPDCVEYGTYRTGIRAEGVTFSMQTFTTKLCAALASALAMLTLAAFGFQSGEGVVQTATAVQGIWFTFSLMPAIGCVLALVVLHFYQLNDHDVQLMAEYNQGSITREECDAQLSRRY